MRVSLLDESRKLLAKYEIHPGDPPLIWWEMQGFLRESSTVYVRTRHYYIGPHAEPVK